MSQYLLTLAYARIYTGNSYLNIYLVLACNACEIYYLTQIWTGLCGYEEQLKCLKCLYKRFALTIT